MPSIPSTDVPLAARRPRYRLRKILAIGFFVVALLATIIAGFYLIERNRGRAQWQLYQAEARERGAKLTLQEYVPPPVPDAENFAAIPIFEDTFRAAVEHRPIPNPFALPESGAIMPSLGDAVLNKPLDLAAWQKFFVATKTLDRAGDNPARDVLRALERYTPGLEQLREAGTRPFCRFPVRWEDGVMAMLPHLHLFPSAARIYALRMGAHLALGDTAAAGEDFRGGLRLHSALSDEPSLVAGLVRLAVLNTMENALWDGLAKRQWTDASLRQIIDDLAVPHLFAEYEFAIGSERAFDNLVHEQLRSTDAGKLREVVLIGNNGVSANEDQMRWKGALLSAYPSGWTYFSQVRSNRYIDEMLARVSVDPPRIFPERAIPARPDNTITRFQRLAYLPFYLLVPALEEMERTYGRSQTLLDETRLGCALERCRLAQGSYPPSLDALAPSELFALPRDVMNGEPLHYEVDADGGYRLWSVGWDLRDDGGKTNPQRGAKQQLDWIWNLPAPAKP
ncbi:hypothetical protein CfE428DRAFT_0108 [Chthoniobacter flavus Ellin428]|uniref:Uncharacterized protein n=1 Tax=Chthoniobacter flavus Ellin428 TaxID=497964 RepID=B4CTU5_9BACT|nr:hypothetical protein [Chthoniobacter flavus]EDY21983.1 hypothetical protein CfE428DRAFT_0108 [Chthoniobacter flavus Ellin428]TCO89370.1 hypothetical protein EV701_114104 [Chthoniobacter flavus]